MRAHAHGVTAHASQDERRATHAVAPRAPRGPGKWSEEGIPRALPRNSLVILPNYLNEQILDGEPVPPWPYVQLTHGLLITLDASEALPTSCRCCGEAVSLLARSPPAGSGHARGPSCRGLPSQAASYRKPQAPAWIRGVLRVRLGRLGPSGQASGTRRAMRRTPLTLPPFPAFSQTGPEAARTSRLGASPQRQSFSGGSIEAKIAMKAQGRLARRRVASRGLTASTVVLCSGLPWSCRPPRWRS